MHILSPQYLGLDQAPFYQHFLDGLEDAFLDLGHTLERIGFAKYNQLTPAEQDTLFRWREHSRCEMVIDLCCWGWAFSHLRHGDGDNKTGPALFDSLDSVYCGLMFDQPYFQPWHVIQSERLLIGHPDRGHPELMRQLCPFVQPRAHVFMPPATREDNDRSSARAGERPIAVLYLGNLDITRIERPWRGLPQAPWLDLIADLALKGDRPLVDCVNEVISSLQIVLTREQKTEVLRGHESWLRMRLRYEVVRSLAEAGIPMHVCGRGWVTQPFASKLTIHSETDYEGLLLLLGQSNICLDASTYLNGANDRVFNAMVNSAYCITNASGWLREEFAPGEEDGFYSPSDTRALAGALRELLAAPQQLQERAQRARAKALARHTWHNRAVDLLAAVGKLQSSEGPSRLDLPRLSYTWRQK